MKKKVVSVNVLQNDGSLLLLTDDQGGLWLYRTRQAEDWESKQKRTLVTVKKLGSLPEGDIPPHKWHMLIAKTGEWVTETEGQTVLDAGF